MRTQGTSLVELSIALALILGVFSLAHGLLSHAWGLADATARTLDASEGVRALVENLVRDVSSMQQVMDPAPLDGSRNLVLVRPLTDDVAHHPLDNPDQAFPFARTGAPSTVQVMSLVRVSYLHDPVRRTVSRVEEPGQLVCESTAQEPAALSRFRFVAAGPRTARVLAGSIVLLELVLAGHDPLTGRLRPAGTLDGPGSLAYHRAEVVAVRVRARPDDGGARGDQAGGEVELLTKIWSSKRRSDHVHRPYFSSTDEDLRW